MPLKDQLTLPTKLDAIAVRPESLPVPPGKTERRELRTPTGKTFVHAEKAPDGKEIRTCQTQLGAVCYRDDDGQLRSIDTTIRDLGTHVGIEWAPYKFKLHETGIGFDFESREGGQCTVTLTGIGGEKFEDSIKPEVTDNTITYRDVRPGCDIVFKCLNERVKTLRILRDDKAPRTFDWAVTSDKPELIDSTLSGTDAAGNELELASEVDGDVIRETWSGAAGDSDPVYPVEIDPSVTVNPAVSGDDGREFVGSGWDASSTQMFFGCAGGPIYHPGIRFPSVSVPRSASISLATLGLYSAQAAGSGGQGTIYGRAVDNAGQFGSGSDLPSAVDKTSASVALSADATTGQKTWDITSITQEIVNRGGWNSGQAMAIPIITSSSGTNYTGYYSWDAGFAPPYLEVTYTAAAAGGTAKNLLLLGCG